MFTGLIEATGEIAARTPTTGGQRISVRSPLTAELKLGDSVAVNGVCLTVVQTDATFHADVGPETLRVTTLGSLDSGALVNLERPLRGDGRMGGHFVQGHVDAVGQIADLRPESDFLWLTVSFPPDLAPYFIRKGSVAVDGISRTLAEEIRSVVGLTRCTRNLKSRHTNLSRQRKVRTL